MYKESLFNISHTLPTGEYCIYNTRSGKSINISSAKRESFLDILHMNSRNSAVFDYLFVNGFIVRDNTNEIEEVIDEDNRYMSSTLFLTIIPTLSCNFRCPYCFETHNAVKMSRDVENKILEYLSDKLKNFRRLSLIWYGGEPLLEVEIIDRLSKRIKEICNLLHISFLSSITTNGYNLTWENYLKLKSNNIRHYTVTVDCFKEYHDVTRPHINGNSTFDRIIDNLLNIKNRDKSIFSRFIIRTNFTKESIKRKTEWDEYVKNNFLDDPRFSYLPRYAWNNENSTYSEDSFIEFDFNDNISNLDVFDIDALSKLECDDYVIDSVKVQLEQLHNKSAICPAGRKNSLIIGPQGLIYKCQVCIENGINCVGFFDASMSRIIFDGNKLSNWENRDYNNRYKACTICQLFPFCMGKGCAAKTSNSNELELEWCEKFKNEIIRYLVVLASSKKFSELEEYL